VQPLIREGSRSSASFRHQVFSTSRRLSPHSGLRAYSIPLPRPGFPPVQGLLSPRSHPSSSEGVAPRPLLRSVLTDLRRLPPAPDLGFEAFIRARPRSIQHSYSPRCTPLPSSGSSPPGPHFLRSIAFYLRSPLSTFLSPRLRFHDRASSSSPAYLPTEAWRLRLRFRPPARAFEPSSKSPCS
jgi:hypothetical protein